MNKIAIIGAGISGLSAARLLSEKYEVKVFEKESVPGGLIRCERINGNLFHICGGHVFNSKNEDVLNWFWTIFDKEKDFVKTDRNAVVLLDNNKGIPYPIENHMYLFEPDIQKLFIKDLIYIAQEGEYYPENFEEFLIHRFGKTLYNIYFKPYNEKVWRRDLSNVPLTWLEGKLPMPTVNEMIYNNMNHIEEKQFVHSSFWYEKNNGSQFIADKLSKRLNIQYGVNVKELKYVCGNWYVCGEKFDKILFCGNIKVLPHIIVGIDISPYISDIDALEYHGTTSVFCEIDKNPYSWIYQPSRKYLSHRVICTGNFSPTNNIHGKMTGTIEFTDYISKESILKELSLMPLHPKYLTHHYSEYSYPIQDRKTRCMISSLKEKLATDNFYFTGRFADWEYYNMDVAISAAMKTIEIIKK